MTSEIQLFTDGSIIGNPNGDGGWAFVYVNGDRHFIKSGSEHNSTNNRMEMQAAIEALRLVSRMRMKIQLISDSEYLIKGFTEGRVAKWAARNFHRGKSLVPNSDLWRALNDLDVALQIEWIHQRGEHAKPETLDGPRKWAAIAHESALSEARLAHKVRLAHLEGSYTPETREGNLALLGEVPNPPDPPAHSGFVSFCVYQRIGSPANLVFRGPVFIPMSPSLSEDNGKTECKQAARTMSKTDDTKEGMRYRDWNIARYVVLRSGLIPTERKSDGKCYYHFSEEQYERLSKEALNGHLRAVPGG